MKKGLILFLFLISSILIADWHDFGKENDSMFNVAVANEYETELEFNLDGFNLEKIEDNKEIYWAISYPGEGEFMQVGMPGLPRFSRLIAIPANADVELEILGKSEEIFESIKVFPQQQLQSESKKETHEFVINSSFYDGNETFPNNIAELGEPAILRDLRVITLTINPFSYDAGTNELNVIHNLKLKVTTKGNSNKNVKLSQRPISRFFEPLYESAVLNYSSVDRSEYQQPSYLFIYPDNAAVENSLQMLLDWKHQKGFKVTAVSTAETGTSLNNIKNYIQNAYDNWDNPPEFITIVGDAGGTYNIPTGSYSGGEGDQYYVLLEGNDILADAHIGRLSFNDVFQLQTIITKILNYEKEPYLENTNWYEKAAFFGDPSTSGYSCVNTKVYIKEMMGNEVPNYSVQGIYDTSHGSWVSQMRDSIDGGISYFNYRGYYGMSGWSASEADNLNNGYMLPFVVSLTCGTGNFEGTYDCVSERFLKTGSPSEPKGAIGAVATATISTHTTFNNCVDAGIFFGIFQDDLYQMGAALNRGKLNLYLNFPNNPSNSVEKFSYWTNLMGDPALELWTGIPRELDVEHNETIALGSNYMEVTVSDENGSAVRNAWVSVVQGEDTIFANDFTNNQGKVLLPINADEFGEAKITVTKHNFIPYLNEIEIEEEGKFINSYGVVIDDDNSGQSSGNNDGIVNPGEDIELIVKLKNYGSATVYGVEAELISMNEDIIIEDSFEDYGNIESGQTAFPNDNYLFSVPNNILGGTNLEFVMNISDSDGNTWQDFVIIELVGAYTNYMEYDIIDDNNGILDPGETADLSVTIMNIGSIQVNGVEGELNCSAEGVNIIESEAEFGSLIPSEEVSNTEDYFTLEIESQILPGSQIPLRLALSNLAGFQQTVSFVLTIGLVNENDPLGKDDYGYYAYEDNDVSYSLAPVYNWIEIDDDLGGEGTEINLSDSGDNGDIETILLPFEMKFYGRYYDEITVCSNGWIAPGHTNQASYMNWQIPGPLGPSPIIAVFWDDLKTTSGDVWYYYDESLHCFIIEWSNMKNDYDNATETFQAIIYDPAYYNTPTGDSEILMQYKDISNSNQGSYGGWVQHGQFSTIGIANHNNNIGLQYTYCNQYPDACAELEDGRAILYTTRGAEILEPPHLEITQQEFTFALQENDSETKTLQISNSGESNLSFNINKDYEDIRDSGGPDGFGYEWWDSNYVAGPVYNWRDISDMATPIDFPHNDDSGGTLPLGFTFEYYGQEYDEFRINPNGWIGFGSDWTDYHNYSIPDPDAPRAAIFTFWDDLYPEDDEGGGGQVYYYSDSDSLVVWFNDVIHYPGQDNGTYDFQTILYESGEILMQYRNLQGEINSTTVGIQDEDGEIGLQVAYNENYLENNLAIKFKKQIDWLQLSSSSGLVPSGETVEIEITADSEELTYGEYACTLQLTTNDPENSFLEIPVDLLVVSELPDISVSQEIINFGAVAVDEDSTQTLIVQNTGSDFLEINSIEITNEVFSCDSNSFQLNPGEQKDILVTFAPTVMQEYSAQLIINSNDPDEPTFNISLLGSGVFAGVPNIEISASELDFGMVEVGQDSTLTLEIRNNGELELEIDEIVLESEVFNYSPEITTIAAGETENLELTFSPEEAELYQSTLHILSNDPENSDIEISLSGEGVQPSSADNPDIPLATELIGNYPNPFNPQTKIKFSLKENSMVNLAVFNVKGQIVYQLLNENLETGYYDLVWNGIDSSGHTVSSGVYFYKLQTDNMVQIRKMMLLK